MSSFNITPEKITDIKSATDIVEVIGEHVSLKKNGADHFGLCPFHTEKTASFSVSPAKQMFYCFGCGVGGDVIEFLLKTGMSFTDAIRSLADKAGISLPAGKIYNSANIYHTPRPPVKKTASVIPVPEGRTLPDIPEGVVDINLWREKAAKLVDWAHGLLLENDNIRRWLLKRGIKKKTIIKFKLGINPGRDGNDLFRSRESWGLKTILKENGHKLKMKIPSGLVIPKMAGDEVVRIRIRTKSGVPKYFVIKGSSTATLAIRADARAVVVVESELDAMLLDQEAEDLAGVVALGSSSTLPDRETVSGLIKTSIILQALDYDQAGLKASGWWQDSFPQVVRWPVPMGNDPGEAYQAGVDLRQWIIAGLPPGWRIGQSLLGSIKKGEEGLSKNGTPSKQGEDDCDGREVSEALPLKNKDRAIYSLSESPPLKQCIDVPEKVQELADILKRVPVAIYVSPKRVTLRHTPAWGRKNWDLSKKISNLVFMTPEVFDYVCSHLERVINGKNII